MSPLAAILALAAGAAGPRAEVFLGGRPGPAFVRAGAPVEVEAVLRLPGRRADAATRSSIRWFLAVPLARDYDNTRACGLARLAEGCHEPIAWERRELPGLAGRTRFDASRVPSLAAPGTHRLAARFAVEGEPVESADWSDPGAAGAGFAELVVRRGDGYVGLLTEQLGTPFVYAPVRLADGRHQADARLGVDCAALLVYGRRRLGERVRYVAPSGLDLYADEVTGPARPGDILHFGFQTAALAEDRPPMGVVDDGDLVLHAYHGAVEEVPLGSLPYRRMPMRILRWRTGPR